MNMYPSLILLVFSLVDDQKRGRIESVSVKRCKLLPHVSNLLSHSLELSHTLSLKYSNKQKVFHKLGVKPRLIKLSGGSHDLYFLLIKRGGTHPVLYTLHGG